MKDKNREEKKDFNDKVFFKSKSGVFFFFKVHFNVLFKFNLFIA